MMEWLGGESDPPCTTKEGASLLLLRPARYKLGTVEKEDWLRPIAWHGARATSEWPSDADTDKPGHGAVAIIVDRTCSGVRNQDPRLLRFLLPPLIRHYPASLHRAYVGPVNYVFYGIWAVATLILPRRVAGRFMLLRGSDWKAQLQARARAGVSGALPDNLRDTGDAAAAVVAKVDVDGGVRVVPVQSTVRRRVAAHGPCRRTAPRHDLEQERLREHGVRVGDGGCRTGPVAPRLLDTRPEAPRRVPGLRGSTLLWVFPFRADAHTASAALHLCVLHAAS